MTSKDDSYSLESDLLKQSLAYLAPISEDVPILDLACGKGRNGLCLLENSHSVVFADKCIESLASIKQQLNTDRYNENRRLASFWPIDFEQENFTALAKKNYGAIVVFRYLHRELFTQIKQAIIPGGVVVYETFTTEQAKFGRPKNPKFLLKPGELSQVFSDWKILHYFEGIVENTSHCTSSSAKQAISQIIAIKPE